MAEIFGKPYLTCVPLPACVKELRSGTYTSTGSVLVIYREEGDAPTFYRFATIQDAGHVALGAHAAAHRAAFHVPLGGHVPLDHALLTVKVHGARHVERRAGIGEAQLPMPCGFRQPVSHI